MNTLRYVQRFFVIMAATCLLLLSACDGDNDNNKNNSNMNTPPPDLSISVEPTSIALGQSATVTWNASAGSSCTASGAWSGDVESSGTSAVTPTAVGTQTYTLACTGSGAYSGTVTQSTSLEVTASASAFSTTRLIGDTAAAGPLHTDPNLVNPWGIVFGPATPVWVANNHSDTSTIYDGNGNILPLVVNIPGSGDEGFEPTGIVFNDSTDFVVTSGANSGAARFIFAGESGMLAGWSQDADPGNAVTVYTATDEALYMGLAIANNGSGNFLYAADFLNGKVDVFDANFVKQTPSGSSFAFTDPNLPEGYAPFGIQALNTGAGGETQIYVAYAQADDEGEEVPGAGLGLVSVYDTNGNFIKRLIPPGGQLDAPWGMTLAPAEFGTLSNTLLVGNFGDGKINGFDVSTGESRGTIADAAGNAFAVPGLWGIAFGNDAMNQPHNTLFYAAGTNGEVNGEYGRIDLGASPPVLGEPLAVAITAPAAGTVSGTVTVTANVTASVAIAQVELFANDTSLGVVTNSPYSVSWDTTTVTNGSFSLTAVVSDVNSNVATSAPVAVTVNNIAPPVATTLTELQTSIFTPICTSCHTGGGSVLPASMNLTAGNSFATLVSVPSVEQPSMLLVAPGDAANSYLIHKLEGAPGITGARMPLGLQPLDQATIDQVESWINAGALNN